MGIRITASPPKSFTRTEQKAKSADNINKHCAIALAISTPINLASGLVILSGASDRLLELSMTGLTVSSTAIGTFGLAYLYKSIFVKQ